MPHAKGLTKASPHGVFESIHVLPNPGLPGSLSYEYPIGILPPVFDQGDQPSCVGNGSAGWQQFIAHKRTGNSTPVSRDAIYSQGRSEFEDGGDPEGGMMISSAVQVMQKYGYVPESEFAFDDADMSKAVPAELWKKSVAIYSYREVPLDADSIEYALHQFGPVLIGTDWFEEWEDIGPDGVMPDPGDAESNGGHCVLIVGYSRQRQAFRIRNSWGTGWGDGGYAFLPYSAVRFLQNAYTVQTKVTV